MKDQIEMVIPEQPKNPTKYCGCLKGDRVVVVMQRSISPDFLIGRCFRCEKIHTQRLQ